MNSVIRIFKIIIDATLLLNKSIRRNFGRKIKNKFSFLSLPFICYLLRTRIKVAVLRKKIFFLLTIVKKFAVNFERVSGT